MKRIFIETVVVLLMMCPLGFAQNIKEPNVSGQFYDADAKSLANRIDLYLSQAKVSPSDENIKILISPHAGYEFSGPVAAYSYKAISQKKYHTVVILAVSHYYPLNGISVWPEGGFRTPLGVVPVDAEFSKKILAADPKFLNLPQIFEREHSLEVQLPFLQRVLKDFKIVPIIMGQTSVATAEKLAETLNKIIGDRQDVLVVASSDMSHYHVGEEARAMDKSTLEIIAKMDIQNFWNDNTTEKKEMCGFVPVTTAMFLALKQGARPKILHYANSGDVTGDYSRVVGYGSVIFIQGAAPQPTSSPIVENKENLVQNVPALSMEQKKVLMGIARNTLTQFVQEKKVPDIQTKDSRLMAEDGAFVTLRKKGDLRGCIGNIIGQGPLYLTIRNMAVAAASEDPRFAPVSAAELKDIDVEISVLSKPRRISDPKEIIMGKHGVIVRKGFRGGVFLPQVATETGWSREEFLSNLCSQKAGLPADAWKDPQTVLEIFSAEVFSEKDVQ